jgi:hypothetical protein
MHVGGIFCDLIKAFHYLNHEILQWNYIIMAFKEQ